MWVWRKMEKISWRDMKTNDEVLQMVQEERSLMDVIWRRKKNLIGRILRGESLLREVIEGRMIIKRPRGRKRLGMLNEFLKESSYAELKRKPENRKEWKTWKPRTCLTAEHYRRRIAVAAFVSFDIFNKRLLYVLYCIDVC